MRSGASRLIGFALSVLALAAASLAVIPAMVAASGDAGWGAIALGQAIGTIGGVAVGYGWNWFGPARIAQFTAHERRLEYVESLLARGSLAPPVSAVAAAVAYGLASSMPLFAAAAAVAATCVGLSASWYFVGLAKPFTMFALDTLPRVTGTAGGVVLMWQGYSAVFGLFGIFGGIMAGQAFSSAWIFWDTKRAGAVAGSCKRRSLKTILFLNRHGIASALGSAAYSAAPLAIVSVVAPSIQPAFALADRIRGQVFVASAPAATVLQGWVPRATEATRVRRANIALLSASLFAIALGVGTMILSPTLVNWLGGKQIYVSWEVLILMSGCVAVIVFQLVLERAALATFGRLRVVAKAIAIGALVGLPLVGVGARELGTAGAMGGVLAGLLVCVFIELLAYSRYVREL